MGTATLEKFGTFKKVKHKFIISAIPLRYLTKRNANICPHKDLYTYFHSSIFTMAQSRNNPSVHQLVNG